LDQKLKIPANSFLIASDFLNGPLTTDSKSIALFTKIRDFLHGRCKKSLLDVNNLPVAFIVGISNITLDPDSERGALPLIM
jgi:hypothetical protein